MQEIRTEQELSEVLGADTAIVFKHSQRCYISRAAWFEVDRFVTAHPEAPLVLVDVIESRGLSQKVASATGIRHESPQVLFLRKGRVVWHDSHEGITEGALEGHLVTLHG